MIEHCRGRFMCINKLELKLHNELFGLEVVPWSLSSGNLSNSSKISCIIMYVQIFLDSSFRFNQNKHFIICLT